MQSQPNDQVPAEELAALLDAALDGSPLRSRRRGSRADGTRRRLPAGLPGHVQELGRGIRPGRVRRRAAVRRRSPCAGGGGEARCQLNRPATSTARAPRASGSAGRRTAGARTRPASRRRRRRGAGSPTTSRPASAAARPRPSITFDAFCDLFLDRHGATVAAAHEGRRSRSGWRPRARTFGAWTLRELEGAAADVAAWRATLCRRVALPPDRRRCGRRSAPPCAGATSTRNPAVDAGRNPQPRAEELQPVHAATRSTRSRSNSARSTARSSSSPPRRACGTNEWVALERRDVDRAGPRGRRAAPLRRRRADAVPEDGALAPARPADRPRPRRARRAAAAARHAAAVPGGPGRPHRPRHLADARVVPGARRGRDRPARPVRAAAHLRDRGAGRRHLDLRAGPRDGHVASR